VDKTAEALRQLVAWSSSHGLHICVDLASAPDGCKRIAGQAFPSNAVNLFDDVQADDAQAVAPHLLPVDGRDAGRWLARSLELAREQPAVTWIFGALPTHDLTQRLKRRLDVEFTDSQSLMLRFFDPRILAELKACLLGESAAQFFAVGSIWAYLDRDGQLQHIVCGPENEHDPIMPPLALNQAEQDALLLASEAGQVMAETMQRWPDDLARLSPLARFALSKAACKQAEDLGRTGLSDKVLLLMHAAGQGERFFESSAWTQHQMSLQKGQTTLAQLALGELA
jgi:hypothetical protein